jgi:hypothetical protein
MSPVVSSPPSSSSRHRRNGTPAGVRAARVQSSCGMVRAAHPLACYLDAEGRPRELLARPGHAGSVLVLDRDAATLCDRRLVAHLAADEPPENAELVCRLYLADPDARWCRRVRPSDLEHAPEVGPGEPSRPGGMCHDGDMHSDLSDLAGESLAEHAHFGARVTGRRGNVYRLELLPGERAGLQLRWTVRRPTGAWERVGLRDVVGSIESYEPVRTLTLRALASEHRLREQNVSLARVRAELERLSVSPIVLNRRLREALLARIDAGGLSMSEVALRCGMVKCDRNGRLSGETSWLARRVGIMPEGGGGPATPWIHSDVLGLIARRGLGVSPREVEL